MVVLAGALSALIATTGAAAAQVPEELRPQLQHQGQTRAYERTVALYEPLLAAAPTIGVVATKDLSYGPDPRHRLDVYRSSHPQGAPVLVFVHGGAYVGGDRDITVHAYGNVPTYFARQGLVAVSATYRLAAAHPWPAGAVDIGDLVAWLQTHAAELGGDPARIFLMGHSAGATHVAGYLFDSRFHPREGPGVAGAILVSGRYRVDPEDAGDPRMSNVRAYFGDDPRRYRERSPITHAATSEAPVLLAIAEYDPPDLVRIARDLFAELCRRPGGCPPFVELRHHNHMSEVLHFNTGDDVLGRAILDFIRSTTASSPGPDRAPRRR